MKKTITSFLIILSMLFLVSCVESNSLGYTVKYYYEAIESDAYVLEETKNYVTSSEGEVIFTPENKAGFSLNENISVLSGNVTTASKPTFFIYYDRLTYDVIFKVDNSIYESLNVKYQDVISVNDPTKTGYEFIAWQIDQTGNVLDLSQPIENSYVLNAIFDRIDNPVEDPYEYSGYYEGAKGLYDDELINFLHQTINAGFEGVTYGDARYMLDDTDQDPNNVNNVILVYLGTSVSGTWDAGNTWNREHVWPQSFLGVDADNSTVNSASDLHNLKPSNPSENSSRSNKYFGNETTYQTYNPLENAEVANHDTRGDVARILFYMDIMYTELSLIYADEGNTYQMGNLEALLEWHILDPVDDFERNRNNIIFSYQKNRNPFIDHPEFVEKIYGDIEVSSIDYTNYLFGSMIESVISV